MLEFGRFQYDLLKYDSYMLFHRLMNTKLLLRDILVKSFSRFSRDFQDLVLDLQVSNTAKFDVTFNFQQMTSLVS